MPQFIAYLGFDGKLEALIRNSEMPGAAKMPPAEGNRIMHANLVLHDGSSLMAGDAPSGQPFDGMKGCMLTMSYPEVDEATRIFNALAAGDTVTMPLQETFWAERFGMLTDRYGTSWAINGGPKRM